MYVPRDTWAYIVFTEESSYIMGFSGGLVVRNPSASAGDRDSIPVSGRCLETEMATHGSILAENAMDRGAW